MGGLVGWLVCQANHNTEHYAIVRRPSSLPLSSSYFFVFVFSVS